MILFPSQFIKHLLLLSSLLFLNPLAVFGDVAILDVALARMIDQRNPVDPFSPPAFCEKDKNGSTDIPQVNSHESPKVFFWNKVSSSSANTLRYSWHRKRENTWEIMAQVDISIRQSSGFRVWSSKKIRPSHQGEWMIVVSISHDPKQVLCISRFLVQ